jgi:acetoin utilization protein AcuB
MMKMRDIMKPVRWTIRSDDTLGTAEWIMARRRLHHLFVVDGGKLAGFLTDRDVLDFRAEAKEDPQWWRASVAGAMQAIPVTANPDEPSNKATERLADSPVDVLPIVERGFVVGQVSASDVLEAELWPIEPPPQPPTTAADVMSQPVIAVDPEDSLLEAATLMVDHEIRHLPVVEGGNVVGMLSDRDIRTIAGDPTRFVESEEREDMRRLNVRDAMTKDVISVRADRPIAEVAHEFAAERIGAIPVVDAGGKLIGIVSYLDALRALA